MVRRKKYNKKIAGIFSLFLILIISTQTIIVPDNAGFLQIIPSGHTPPCPSFNWTETQKILASGGESKDQFGFTVSIDGDTAIVGSPSDNDEGYQSGAAYVFILSGSTWTQQAKLYASVGTPNGHFGSRVSLDHGTALISASRDNRNSSDTRCVYVFIRDGTTWIQQAKLYGSDSVNDDYFGYSVSLSNNSALIGSPWDDDNGVDSGSAYIFARTGTIWTEQQKLLPSDDSAGNGFGFAVSLDGDTALISAWCDDDNGVDSGSVYMFTRIGSRWFQQDKLLALDGGAKDWFGYSVSIVGTIACVGAPLKDDHGENSGAVYIFTRKAATWIQQTKLVTSDGAAGNQFGHDVSLDGDTCLISAWDDNDKGNFSGSAYIFVHVGSNWIQQAKLVAHDGSADDEFSNSVSLSNGTAFIGEHYDDDNGEDSGSVYVFKQESETPGLGINITGGLGIHLKLTDYATTNASRVPWSIHVTGGKFDRINETQDGTIDIPAGTTKYVNTRMLFGFGTLTISVKVAGEERTKKGTQLLICTIVEK